MVKMKLVTKKVEVGYKSRWRLMHLISAIFTSQLSCDKSQENHYFVLVTSLAG